MRTLVYKRTHHGDPDERGRFGCHDCMGRIRRWSFEAVIGIGGVGPEAQANRIAERVNWVGIGPRRVGRRAGNPVLAFEHFHDFGEEGSLVRDCMPLLVRRMYTANVRATMTFGRQAQEQIDSFLARYLSSPPSRELERSFGGVSHLAGGCRVKWCRRSGRTLASRVCG